MAETAEHRKMRQALQTAVIPLLRHSGFTGTYPHYRRITRDKVDLVSFFSRWDMHGAFQVEATVIFPNQEEGGFTNLFYKDDPPPVRKLTSAYGRIRRSLPGMFDDGIGGSGAAFYFVDTYRKPDQEDPSRFFYTAVPPKEASSMVSSLLSNGGKLFIKADESIYDTVAQICADQMQELLRWFDGIRLPEDLISFERDRIQQIAAEKAGFREIGESPEPWPPLGFRKQHRSGF